MEMEEQKQLRLTLSLMERVIFGQQCSKPLMKSLFVFIISKKKEDINFFAKKHSGDRGATQDCIAHWLDLFSKLLEGDYFVGNEVSIADFTVFNILDNYVRPLFKSLLEGHKNLESFRARIAALPNVAAYLVSDRRPSLTLPPSFKVLCTPEECK